MNSTEVRSSSFAPQNLLSQESIPNGKSARDARITPAKTAPIVDRSKVDPSIVKAAEGMEAMFIDYMMQVMRQTVPKNDMDLESPATQIFSGMLDEKYAEKAAHVGGFGLADQIIAYLMSERYNGSQGQGVPEKKVKP
jgi:Rod binding domain-containing protein